MRVMSPIQIFLGFVTAEKECIVRTATPEIDNHVISKRPRIAEFPSSWLRR